METYLNLRGEAALLDAVRRCWASLWTARAISCRANQGIPPAAVSLVVVGVAGVTQQLHTGQRVRVDGDNGLVVPM
jgi:phosphoenolpyruvate synthase/pyruvate phosphate dikinase